MARLPHYLHFSSCPGLFNGSRRGDVCQPAAQSRAVLIQLDWMQITSTQTFSRPSIHSITGTLFIEAPDIRSLPSLHVRRLFVRVCVSSSDDIREVNVPVLSWLAQYFYCWKYHPNNTPSLNVLALCWETQTPHNKAAFEFSMNEWI